MKRITLLLATAVTTLLASVQQTQAEDRWCIVDPQHYETVHRDIFAEVQFLEEECVWSEELGSHAGMVFAYCTADWEYHQMHYFYHAAVQYGHTQYFDSDAACLRQLNAYDYKQE